MWFGDLLDLLTSRLTLLALAFVRMAALVSVWPLIAQPIPRTVKIAIAIVLTLVAAPAILAGTPTVPTDALPIAALREAMIGFAAGFLIRVMLSVADVVGEATAQATGMGAPSLFNPEMGGQETAIGRIFNLIVNLSMLLLGVHRVVILLMLEAFKAVPVGSESDVVSFVPMLVSHTASALEFGIILALPTIGLGLLVQVTLALISRVAPSLQIFNAGFPVMILAGLSTLSLTLPTIVSGLGSRVTEVAKAFERLLLAFVPS